MPRASQAEEDAKREAEELVAMRKRISSFGADQVGASVKPMAGHRRKGLGPQIYLLEHNLSRPALEHAIVLSSP